MLLLVSRGPSGLFPVVAVPLCIPPAPPRQRRTRPCTLTPCCVLVTPPQQVRGDPSLLLLRGSRTVGDAKHLFCWPFSFFFGRMSVQILSPFLNWYFFYIYIQSYESLTYVGYYLLLWFAVHTHALPFGGPPFLLFPLLYRSFIFCVFCFCQKCQWTVD